MSYSSNENGKNISDSKQRVHIHMDKELRKEIDKKAVDWGMNRSEYVCTVLKQSLDNDRMEMERPGVVGVAQ